MVFSKNWPQQYFWSHMFLQRLLLVSAHHKPEPTSLLLALQVGLCAHLSEQNVVELSDAATLPRLGCERA